MVLKYSWNKGLLLTLKGVLFGSLKSIFTICLIFAGLLDNTITTSLNDIASVTSWVTRIVVLFSFLIIFYNYL